MISFPPQLQARIDLAASCADCESIPKVEGAGELDAETGTQIMHNGVRVLRDCYYGAWMTELIRRLRGHHEPQEEKVFHHILQRLRVTSDSPSILELGSFWAYYSLWALQALPNAEAYLVEPDPHHLKVGQANFHLNGRQGVFLQAAVAGESADYYLFRCEDGQVRNLPIESLESLLSCFSLTGLALLCVDVQGFETEILENSRHLFQNGKIRFLILSTHHHSISKDPDTHEKCLKVVKECGGHIIAEHTVAQSFSGDGLIAASFHEKDRDLRVSHSYADESESLFAGS